MLKVALWLVLSLFSGSGVIIYALQQQYEEQSVTYRILYREVTVKLSQLETVLSLLSVSSDPAIVQQKFPQIVAWKRMPQAQPIPTLTPTGEGTYWLAHQHFALLIDPALLFADIPQRHDFRQIGLSWHNKPLFEQGDHAQPAYWQWDKGISSASSLLHYPPETTLIGRVCLGCCYCCCRFSGLLSSILSTNTVFKNANAILPFCVNTSRN